MAKIVRFSEELKGLLKTLSIRMVEQLGLWQPHPETGKLPTWSEQEITMTRYMSNEEELNKLLDILKEVIEKIPEDAVAVGYVTVNFIEGTYKLLQAYKEVEFKDAVKVPEPQPEENANKGA